MPRPGHFRLGALGGPTPVDSFSPAQHNALTRRPDPATPGLKSLGGRTPTFLPTHSTQTLWFLAARSIHVWLGALGGQTIVFDHPTFCCFSPLQPLALSILRPRRSGTSLGRTVQHMHTGLSCLTTHRKSHNQIEKQTIEPFQKTNPSETENGEKHKKRTWI